MKHHYHPHAPSGVKTQVWSPIQLIFHQIDRLKWWYAAWGINPHPSPAALLTLSNINHNLQLHVNTARNPSKAFTIWTKQEQSTIGKYLDFTILKIYQPS